MNFNRRATHLCEQMNSRQIRQAPDEHNVIELYQGEGHSCAYRIPVIN